MEIRFNYALLITFILLCASAILPAHNLNNLEQQLSELIRRQVELKNQLAAHQADFNSQIKSINNLKSDRDNNEERLRSELRKSKSTSKQIQETESAINDLAYQIELTKQKLRNQYTHLIDSLRAEGRDLSDIRLNTYFFRRLELTPEIKSLSFNPKVITEADLTSSDSLEQAIIKNYLELAISEIDSNLKMIQDTEIELAEQLRFARKTERFLEDIGESPGFSVTQSSEMSYREPATDIGFSGGRESILNNKSRTYSEIIFQISPYLSTTTEARLSGNTEISNLDQYLNLVQKTIQYLKLYRESITDKLNQNH